MIVGVKPFSFFFIVAVSSGQLAVLVSVQLKGDD
jgi:hypothetical protein